MNILTSLQPKIMAGSKRHGTLGTTINKFLEEHPLAEALNPRLTLIIPPVEDTGIYHMVPLTQNGNHEEDRTLIVFDNGAEEQLLFRESDFLQHRAQFEAFHPIQPARRKVSPNIMRKSLEERLAEEVARHHLRELLGKGDYFHTSHPGKDLVIKAANGYVLKRERDGSIVILSSQSPDAKFEYGPIAELDGLLAYDERTLIVMEAKHRRANTRAKHARKDVIVPLKALYPERQLYYAFISHHGQKVVTGNRRSKRTLGLKAHLQEKYLCVELAEEGVETLLVNFPINREAFGELAEHIIAEYHRAKHLPYERYTNAVLGKNDVRLLTPDKQTLLHLRKNGPRVWKEV